MTRQAFVVSGVRITHQDVPVGTLESATIEEPQTRLDELLDDPAVSEAFVFQTCNRVEEYVVTDTQSTGQEVLRNFPTAADQAVTETGHEASLRHLLRIAAGLESQVLGEDEILGQIRSAYTTAKEAGALGPVLDAGLLKAIHVGERARTETAINEGIVSLGSAAVRLADQETGLTESTAIIIGAGQMAERVGNALADSGVDDLRIVNRSLTNATDLADRLPLPATTIPLDDLRNHLPPADIVITSTASPEPIIDHQTVAGAGDTLFIDLGQPRDIAPEAAEHPPLTVYDLDDLESVTAATHADRAEAAEAVEAIVDEEFDLLMDQYKRNRADAVIAGMYQGAERMKEREVSRALAQLEQHSDLSQDARDVIDQLGDALVNQLLAVPTQSLRDAAADDDWETISTAIELFDPDVDEFTEQFSTDMESSESHASGSSE